MHVLKFILLGGCIYGVHGCLDQRHSGDANPNDDISTSVLLHYERCCDVDFFDV